MPCKTDVAATHTIGIDTGKNTLHIIGLSQEGAIVLGEKVQPDCRTACERAAMPYRVEAGMASHHVARELLALG